MWRFVAKIIIISYFCHDYYPMMARTDITYHVVEV